VAEDEPVIAMFLEEALAEAGGVVIGPAVCVGEALKLATSGNADAAVLDIRLGGRDCFAVATALRERGTPFLFLTGCSVRDVPDYLRGQPLLEKPFRMGKLLGMIAELLLTPRTTAALQIEEVGFHTKPARLPF
jgi:DNA-binding response OmpR family regulator